MNKDNRKIILTIYGVVAIFVLFCFVMFLIFPFISVYVEILGDRIVKSFSQPHAWKFIGILLFFIVGVVLFFRYILPIACYVVSKTVFYFSLRCFCKRNGYKIHTARFPIAAAFGVGSKADIAIEAKEKRYQILFVDIVFRRRRAFVWLGDSQYCISPVAPGNVKEWRSAAGPGVRLEAKGFLRSGYEIEGQMNRVKKVVLQETATDATMLCVLFGKPILTNVVKNSKSVPLTSGERIDDFVFLHARDLKRFLNGDISVFISQGED